PMRKIDHEEYRKLLDKIAELFVDMVTHDDTLFILFSSRRRHTRSYGDWSSDVCSSDLRMLDARRDDEGHQHERQRRESHERHPRSEERRVGKECRYRWETGH